jgi:putative DNA methylase
VVWENSTNEAVLREAREEILKATDGNPPPVLDPFCGGGSIPLEAQRLGLEAHGSDLNPVAVLITKALIEIPPRFAGQPPVNPTDRAKIGGTGAWRGAAGLAADVRHYGAWMRAEAEKRIGHLYPKARLPKEMGGGEATVIAWLWARTVKCPNPACGAEMPLITSFALSTKAGKQAWIEPIVEQGAKRVGFEVRAGAGEPPPSPKLGRGAKFRCLVCGQASTEQHIKSEGVAGRMGAQLMAIVAEGARGRTYLSPTAEQEAIARTAEPEWAPTQELANDPRNIWCIPYGLDFGHSSSIGEEVGEAVPKGPGNLDHLDVGG